MARTSAATSRRRAGATKKLSLDFSNVGKMFEAGKDYAVEVKEATIEAGNEFPYIAFKLSGVEEGYVNSIMYHNASTSPQSLYRLAPLLEALGYEVDGVLDIDPADFVGRQMMVHTMEEQRPNGGTSIRPESFWPLDGDAAEGDVTEAEFDLDELDDDQLVALGAALEVKSTKPELIKKALAKMDTDEVAEAFAGLEGEEAAEEFDLDALDDDQLVALGEAMEVKSTKPTLIKKALAKLDQDEVAAAFADLDETSEGGDSDLTEAGVKAMNEEELEELIEEHDLDVDLDDHKTLAKKKVAVIDALKENDLL